MQVDIKAMPGMKAFVVDFDKLKIFELTVEKIFIEKRTDKKNDIFYKFYNYDKRLPEEIVYQTSLSAEQALNLYLLQKMTLDKEPVLEVLS